MGHLHPAFQHIRSDRLATYDFLLVVHSNHKSVWYCLWDKQRFYLKITNVSHPIVPMYLTVLLTGFALELCKGGVAEEKLSPECEKSVTVCVLFRHNTGIGQTDRNGKTVSRSACCARWCVIKIMACSSFGRSRYSGGNSGSGLELLWL